MLTADEAGFVIELPRAVAAPVVAVGGELKNTVCVIDGRTAAVTKPIGDLGGVECYRRFIDTLDRIVAGFAGRRFAVAHDLHPTYLSTVVARRLGARPEVTACQAVQHHHAHVAACLAEHAVDRPVVGIAGDGAGYGSDGAIWGGEVLRATAGDFERYAHLDYFPLPGGDAAAKQTWRPALSLVIQAFGDDLPPDVRKLFDRVTPAELAAVRAMLRAGLNCPSSSSLGRLFDAVAFLAGVCDFNELEGQAAIQLEQAAQGRADVPYSSRLEAADGGARLMASEMIAEICADVGGGATARDVAARFHATVATLFSEAALAAARAQDIDTVVLTGGCFLNRLLADRTAQLLRQGGMKRVFKHERLSPGDASLSLGQAYAAAARLGGR